MRREHRYRVAYLGHVDFGGGPTEHSAHLEIVPDDMIWAELVPRLALRIDAGELAIGDVVRLTIAREDVIG